MRNPNLQEGGMVEQNDIISTVLESADLQDGGMVEQGDVRRDLLDLIDPGI